MSLPFNNLSFPPLHVPKWKSTGREADLKPLAQKMTTTRAVLGLGAGVAGSHFTTMHSILDDVGGKWC